MNTQKCVTTTMDSSKGEHLWIRRCCEPTDKVREVYTALHMKQGPFVKKKSVVLKTEFKKIPIAGYEIDTG